MSSSGECSDIGTTVQKALDQYIAVGEPFAGSIQPNTKGNGSLMRLAPISLFYYPTNRAAIAHFARESSRTTHGAAECIDACRVYASIIANALSGANKEVLLDIEPFSASTPRIKAIL